MTHFGLEEGIDFNHFGRTCLKQGVDFGCFGLKYGTFFVLVRNRYNFFLFKVNERSKSQGQL